MSSFLLLVRLPLSAASEPEATMPKPLTELERRVLDYLIEYLRRNTYQPSIREIGREFSIKSTKTVSELLQSLADKGWIERDPSRSRGVRLHGVDVSADSVAVPVLADTDGAETESFVLDRRIAGGAGAFLLVMHGNHLQAYGVWEGDLVLIEPVTASAIQEGDLVLVRDARGAEVRRCSRAGAELLLDPSGSDETPLSLSGRQTGAVQGRVSGVVRRLRPFAPDAATATLTVRT
jgi:repressor LexA